MLQFVLSPTAVLAAILLLLGFSLLIIRTFVGKPYLLFRVRDYTYKITTEHLQNQKSTKHEKDKT